MVQLVKQSNSSQPDNFLNILLNQLVRSESLSKRVRACRAQSSQNMRAREQNREHRARGLALKSGLNFTQQRSVNLLTIFLKNSKIQFLILIVIKP